MAQFRFSDLPTELRLLVWDAALHQETRLVIIYSYRRTVIPVKQLISPLLTVNRESRQVAKAFYTDTLNVYRNRISSTYSHDPTDKFAGVLHFSFDRDIFVKGEDDQDNLKCVGHDFGEAQTPCYYDTEPIRDEDCGRVQRLLLVRYRMARLSACTCYPLDYCKCMTIRTPWWYEYEEDYDTEYILLARARNRYYLCITASDDDPRNVITEKRRAPFILDLFTDNGASKPLGLIRSTDYFEKEGGRERRKLWDVVHDRGDPFN
ncbi:hypothetical protein F4820DRAFT_464628 [Hypoxylon rubiginosum]|uniref:Uncharacterized protein n=1 Tax=Hypoxylon rubiginosum TaxID=110542 RepID=A0ACB9ZB24_9PEZI|nr:hypothetical protein F4820DRAFT_464628 [Hypoxylon rubiginosum]